MPLKPGIEITPWDASQNLTNSEDVRYFLAPDPEFDFDPEFEARCEEIVARATLRETDDLLVDLSAEQRARIEAHAARIAKTTAM